MPITATNRNRGFTLIELLVAVVILSVATMGLLDVMARYTQINIVNSMRTEAMRIAEARLEQLRGLSFNDTADGLVPDNGTAMPDSTDLPVMVQRSVRKITTNYGVQTIISRMSLRQNGTPNSKALRIMVTWNDNRGMTHQYSAATVIAREW